MGKDQQSPDGGRKEGSEKVGLNNENEREARLLAFSISLEPSSNLFPALCKRWVPGLPAGSISQSSRAYSKTPGGGFADFLHSMFLQAEVYKFCVFLSVWLQHGFLHFNVCNLVYHISCNRNTSRA